MGTLRHRVRITITGVQETLPIITLLRSEGRILFAQKFIAKRKTVVFYEQLLL